MPTVKEKRKPKISIVGTGRLGTALAIALASKGYTIDSLVARHRERALKVAALIDPPTLVLAAKQLYRLPPADLLIIATPDDEIARVVRTLSEVKLNPRQEYAVLHTSGALSSKALSPLSEKGVAIGSIHPMVAVSDPQTGARSLRNAYWCIEGDKRAVRLARDLVRDLEGHSFSIAARDKPLYHASAVMASGNLVALFDVALEMLSHCGLTRSESQRILLPLVESTVHNLEENDPVRALTGTFARGDLQTVQRHLEALSSRKLATARDLYRLLGRRSLDLAKKNGLDPRAFKQIVKTLEK